MKVLFQNRPDALERLGGDTVQMQGTSDHLMRLGVDVDISLEPQPDLAGYDLVHVFNMSTSPLSALQVTNAKRQGVPVALSTIYWDRRHKFLDKDVVRYHESPLVRWGGRLLGPVGPAFLNFLKFRVEMMSRATDLKLMQDADVLLPNSVAEAELLAVQYDAPWVRAKTIVVPNGVDLPGEEAAKNVSAAGDLPFHGDCVLEVGRIEPAKGQLKMIQALFDRPDIPLVFVGRSPNRLYSEACRLLGEERGNTWFLGPVDHGRLSYYYRSAKVHVLPSLRESPGLVTLEAALNGANCVVSVHGPVIEYFGDSVWYCDPAEINSVRSATLEAWDSPKATQLKDRVMNKFTWKKAAESTLVAYEQILSRASK